MQARRGVQHGDCFTGQVMAGPRSNQGANHHRSRVPQGPSLSPTITHPMPPTVIECPSMTSASCCEKRRRFGRPSFWPYPACWPLKPAQIDPAGCIPPKPKCPNSAATTYRSKDHTCTPACPSVRKQNTPAVAHHSAQQYSFTTTAACCS
jgi:hypothetical protein